MSSLLQIEQGKIKLERRKFNLVLLLKVLSHGNLLLGDHACCNISLLPEESLPYGIIIPKNLLDLVLARVVFGDHDDAARVNLSLVGRSVRGRVVVLGAQLFLDFRIRIVQPFKFFNFLPHGGVLHELGRRVNIQEEAVIQALHLECVPRPHVQVERSLLAVVDVEELGEAADLLVVHVIEGLLHDLGDEVEDTLKVGPLPDVFRLLIEREGRVIPDVKFSALAFRGRLKSLLIAI